MKRLLLHVCCGPCATYPVETLRLQFEITLFFSNSNISPDSEYHKRLQHARDLSDACHVPLVEDLRDHNAWLRHVAGMEEEPERGKRCEKCFDFSLRRTARYAGDHEFDLFTTTLTISPHKDSLQIFRVGEKLGPFLAVDLKKKDGFKRSLELSKKLGLYRQTYCGCEFSAGPAWENQSP